jgi:FAD/FMN-containing dehydrogenase
VDVLLTEIANKRIVVDESALTAKIDAGWILHDALDYLAAYGRGYTLGNFPWFTFQTVGGAVCTGSHGSSLSYGSLSSDEQLVALDVVLANGTLLQISRDSHPRLWRAMQVSVGRLGVITAVTFRLVPNAPMTRYKTDITVDAFLDEMKRVQDAYIARGVDAPEVQALDGTMFCWFITRCAPREPLHPTSATDNASLSAAAGAPPPPRCGARGPTGRAPRPPHPPLGRAPWLLPARCPTRRCARRLPAAWSLA